MGVLPLQFEEGDSAESLGLTGQELISISGIADGVEPRQSALVSVSRADGSEAEFNVVVRIDAPAEVEYFAHGGILPMVLRELLSARGL